MAFYPPGRPAPLAAAATASDRDPTARASAAGTYAVPYDRDAVAVRSALAVTSSLRLCLDGDAVDLVAAHAVLPDGTVVLAVDPMTRTGGLLVAARGRPAAARLDVTDLVPIAVRTRVRARVRLAGTVRRLDPASLDGCDENTVGALLDLPPVALWVVEPVGVCLSRAGGDVAVSLGAYRVACPDPLAVDEAAHLAHLVDRHGDIVGQLATLVDPAVVARCTRVVPIALDADGIVLRAEAPDRHVDVRLPFARRVTTGAAVADQLRGLVAGAAAR